jgi:Domain of unknown function (DUF4326)
MARIVHCKREPYDVYIGRPSVWDNPYEIGKDGDRETVIRKYREYLHSSHSLMAQLPELKGKTLNPQLLVRTEGLPRSRTGGAAGG